MKINSNNIWSFDGNDGAGKTTTIERLVEELRKYGVEAIRVPFNMSPIMRKAIDLGKETNYNAVSNTLIHLASLADQIYEKAVTAENDGKIVFIDRYIYSVLARSTVRGFDNNNMIEDWNKHFYYIKNICYFDVSPETALKRRALKGVRDITYWEAGQDVYPDLDLKASFIKFQGNVRVCMKKALPSETICFSENQTIDYRVDSLLRRILESRRNTFD